MALEFVEFVYIEERTEQRVRSTKFRLLGNERPLINIGALSVPDTLADLALSQPSTRSVLENMISEEHVVAVTTATAGPFVIDSLQGFVIKHLFECVVYLRVIY